MIYCECRVVQVVIQIRHEQRTNAKPRQKTKKQKQKRIYTPFNLAYVLVIPIDKCMQYHIRYTGRPSGAW